MDRMNDSILISIKKMLGLSMDYTPFDTDIIIHINSALMTLSQMGVGPKYGFEVVDNDETWGDFLVNITNLSAAKTYIYLQVKMLFDPPTNSFVMDAMKKQADEILFRLNVQAESVEEMDFMEDRGIIRGANVNNIPSSVTDSSSNDQQSSSDNQNIDSDDLDSEGNLIEENYPSDYYENEPENENLTETPSAGDDDFNIENLPSAEDDGGEEP